MKNFCTLTLRLRYVFHLGQKKSRTPNTETHVHKITNVPVLHMALGLNDFNVGKSITLTI